MLLPRPELEEADQSVRGHLRYQKQQLEERTLGNGRQRAHDTAPEPAEHVCRDTLPVLPFELHVVLPAAAPVKDDPDLEPDDHAEEHEDRQPLKQQNGEEQRGLQEPLHILPTVPAAKTAPHRRPGDAHAEGVDAGVHCGCLQLRQSPSLKGPGSPRFHLLRRHRHVGLLAGAAVHRSPIGYLQDRGPSLKLVGDLVACFIA
mmetsp:Transcript_56847/g.169197  ORF Transcript_56847/g.169197 Transcript_56847/m.169197 type:complete len:202 (-) Transcript_56847:765-1370(-)